MNEKVQIEVKYSTDEYIRGMIFSQRKNSSSEYSSWVTFVSGLIGIVAIYYFTHKDEISWDSDLLMKFLLFLMIVVPIAYVFKDFFFSSEIFLKRFLKKQYDSTSLLRETYQISFDAEGINSESDSFTSKVHWNAVNEAVQTDKDLHFFIAHNTSLFIPKRVFTDKQQEEVKHLAQIKLGEKAKF